MDEQLMRLQLDGWCVLENVIPANEVGLVHDSILATTAQQRNPNAPHNIGHVPGVINYDQSVAPYLADQRLLKLLETQLGPHLRISFTTATINEPGNARGDWHADWPFNQRNAGCLPAPYPDVVMHMTTIWMLSDFSAATGGTLVVSGSHRMHHNPTGANSWPAHTPYPTEVNAVGKAGSVLLLDSRLWHATAPNLTTEPRVAIVVRYAPWWLDLSVLRPGSSTRERLLQATGKSENQTPPMQHAVYESLPASVKPFFVHWLV
ncbi:hypothetical protein BH10CHL1_BH10CHL1_00110 [soil metagenome]